MRKNRRTPHASAHPAQHMVSLAIQRDLLNPSSMEILAGRFLEELERWPKIISGQAGVASAL